MLLPSLLLALACAVPRTPAPAASPADTGAQTHPTVAPETSDDDAGGSAPGVVGSVRRPSSPPAPPSTPPIAWYPDRDRDGWGDAAAAPTWASIRPPGMVATAMDCDDGDGAVDPDAVERCDGVDDDCDGLVDGADPGEAGAATWFEDADGDGWGGAALATSCVRPAGAVLRGGDCDDARPEAAERCEREAMASFPDYGALYRQMDARTRLGDADGDGRDDLLVQASLEDWVAVFASPSGELGYEDATWRFDGTASAWRFGAAWPVALDDGPAVAVTAVDDAGDTTTSRVWLFDDLSGVVGVDDASRVIRVDGDAAPSAVWGADLDGDGHRGLAAEWFSSADGGEVRSFEGARGHALDALDARFDVSGEGRVLGDADGDGADDLLMMTSASGVLRARLVTGVPTGRTNGDDLPGTTLRAYDAPTLADVDGDGEPDLVARTSGDELGVWFGPLSGHGEDADAASTGLARYGAMSVGDLDGDGALDVLVTTEHGARVVHGPLSSLPTTVGHERAFSTADGETARVVGDVDGDGADDVVVYGDGSVWASPIWVVSGALE